VWQSIHIADPPAVEGGADLPYGAIYLGTKEGPAGAAPLIGTTLLTYPVEFCSVADPGSGAFFDPWIRNPGWVKKSGSGMNKPDHISESLETSFWVKILKFFYADPGSGKENNSDPG
jgi:hypothetical protein